MSSVPSWQQPQSTAMTEAFVSVYQVQQLESTAMAEKLCVCARCWLTCWRRLPTSIRTSPGPHKVHRQRVAGIASPADSNCHAKPHLPCLFRHWLLDTFHGLSRYIHDNGEEVYTEMEHDGAEHKTLTFVLADVPPWTSKLFAAVTATVSSDDIVLSLMQYHVSPCHTVRRGQVGHCKHQFDNKVNADRPVQG